MARITIVVGVLLIVLALGFYLGMMAVREDPVSLTTLIPAIPGVFFVALGVLAEAQSRWRKHIMHGAVVLGVLVALGGLGMGVPALARGVTAPAVEQTLMGLIGVMHVGLGVKSFIDARRGGPADATGEQT